MTHFFTNQMQIQFNSKKKTNFDLASFSLIRAVKGCSCKVNREGITPSRSDRSNACHVFGNLSCFFPSLEKYPHYEVSGEIPDGIFRQILAKHRTQCAFFVDRDVSQNLGTDGVRCVGNPREMHCSTTVCAGARAATHRTSPVLLYGSLSHGVFCHVPLGHSIVRAWA